MRKLKIGFSYTDKIGSLILRKYMRTLYSHVFVQYDTARHMGDDSIYHSAMGSGVGFYSKKVFEDINEITHLYELEVSDEIYVKIRNKLFAHCGRKYGYLQNLGIVGADVAKCIGMSFENPFRDGFNCSELVFMALLEVDPTLLYEYDLNTIRPDHIELILRKLGAVRIYSNLDKK